MVELDDGWAILALQGPLGDLCVQLREQCEAEGMAPGAAMRVAYRTVRAGELLGEGHDETRVAREVGVSERQVRDDIAALRELLKPRVRQAT